MRPTAVLASTATAVAAVATLVLTGLATTGAQAGGTPAPRTQLHPGKLDRGADVRIPHLEGKTIVDGDTRLRVRAQRVSYVGKSGDDYLVAVSTNDGRQGRALRITPTGDRTVLARGVDIWTLVLSQDGSELAEEHYVRRNRTEIRVHDAVTGSVRTARTFHSNVSVLDFDRGRLVLTAWGPNHTFWWTHASNTTKLINHRVSGTADIRADRLSAYTDDPYNGGCTVVTALTAPRQRLWRSCDERVEDFSANGRRIATIHILSDGPGPGDVWLRKIGGRQLGHYTARWFGLIQFESNRALLLDTFGARQAATVRCDATSCERASALEPVRQP